MANALAGRSEAGDERSNQIVAVVQALLENCFGLILVQSREELVGQFAIEAERADRGRDAVVKFARQLRGMARSWRISSKSGPKLALTRSNNLPSQFTNSGDSAAASRGRRFPRAARSAGPRAQHDRQPISRPSEPIGPRAETSCGGRSACARECERVARDRRPHIRCAGPCGRGFEDRERERGVGGIDHVAEPDAHVEDLVHLAVVDTARAAG